MEVIRHQYWGGIQQGVWDGIVAENPSASVFQSYGWHQAAVKAYGLSDSLCLLGVYEDSVCIAIAPFKLWRKEKSDVLGFIGDERADYCDFIFRPGREDALVHIFDWINRSGLSWDKVELSNIPADSPSWRIINRQIIEQGWSRVNLSPMPCPTIVLDGHSDHVEQVLNKKSIKRHWKYFAGRPGFVVRHLTDPVQILSLLNSFFTQHIHRWSVREEPSLFVHRENRDFYRALLEEASLGGRIVFTEVKSEGVPIAYHFGFIDRGRLLWYKPSFEVQLAKLYPGEVLLRELIVFARDHLLLELDFTRGGELFKNRFANKTRYNHSAVVFRNRKNALFMHCGWQARRIWGFKRWLSFYKDIKELMYVCLFKNKVVSRYRNCLKDKEENKQHYNSQRMVQQYSNEIELQKPEAAILNLLRHEIPRMKVLDIGVGAGRTSVYFGSLAGQYVGVDLAPAMVRICRQRVGDLIAPDCVLEGNACRLSFLDDKSVDMVLISFNCIDCVQEEDRHVIFREVQRVSRQGAWFCFSSHNLQSLTIWGARGLGEFCRRAARYMLLAQANPGLQEMITQEGAMVLDASGDFQMPVYYITPAAQVSQLEAAGFKDVRVFSLTTGQEVKGRENMGKLKDRWIYYLCRT